MAANISSTVIWIGLLVLVPSDSFDSICSAQPNNQSYSAQMKSPAIGVASAAHDAGALHSLAQCYEHGWSVPLDLAQATRLYELAISKNHWRSALRLAHVYLSRGNEHAAVTLLENASKHRLHAASWLLGWCHLHGVLVGEKNALNPNKPQIALQWLGRITDIDGPFERMMFASNWGLAPTSRVDARELAQQWFRIAAKEDPYCGISLLLLRIEVSVDELASEEEVAEVYNQLANADPRLAAFVAFTYDYYAAALKRHDVAQRLWDSALPGLNKLAELGNVDAMQVLDVKLGNRALAEKRALALVRSAEAGDTLAQYRFGCALEDKGELKESENWYRKAAIGGHPLAQKDLANLLNTTSDDAESRDEAKQWKDRASEQEL